MKSSFLKMPWEMTADERANWEKGREHQQREEFHLKNRLYQMADAADEAAVKIGEATIRWAILINGATAGGLLTFAGSLKDHRADVAGTLPFFAFGVVAGASAMACGYLANFFSGRVFGSWEQTNEWPYMKEGPATPAYMRYKDASQYASGAFFILSMALFVFGVFAVKAVLTAI